MIVHGEAHIMKRNHVIHTRISKGMFIIITTVFLCSHLACGKEETGQVELVLPESVEEIEIGTQQDDTVENTYEKTIEKDDQGTTINKQNDLSQEEEIVVLENETSEIEIVMVGDILLHDRVEESALNEAGEYDFSAIFENTKTAIQEADLALVNQEVILGGEELGVSGYPNFNAPFAVGDALVDAGFDVVCHATNHALDRGKDGILNCIHFWQENYPDIQVVGIHEKEEPGFAVYDIGGAQIAILNVTYGTNGISMPIDMPYAVDLMNEEQVLQDIKQANEIADFVIVCPHWGTEYRLESDSMQKKWADLFLKNGVDLVLGTHPHVIEEIEWLEDEENGNRMLVYYSLGNFVNWTSGTGAGTANRMVGGMAKVNLSLGEDGQWGISTYSIVPLVSHVEEGYGKVTTYFLEDYSEELVEQNEIKKQDETFSYSYILELCEDVWGNVLCKNDH